jgi:glycosyltransferase involved in cell wall biosynthesis
MPIPVLEIISGFAIEGPLGGIERFGIELVQALDKAAVAPILCGMWAYDTPYEQGWLTKVVQQGIPAFIAADWQEDSPYRSFVAAYRGARQALAGQQVAIIHSHCQFGDMLAWWLKRPLGAQVLVRTVHNEREWPRRPERRLLLTNGLFPWLFTAELGVGQQVVQNLDARPVARLLGKKGVLAYNALNVSRFTTPPAPVEIARVRTELGLPDTAVVFATIGRLTEQKGYAILLQAIAQLRPQLPHVHWLIIGDGPLASQLQQNATELGVADVVHFLGARPDIDLLLQICHLFVSSSLWEGLPTVILESMAAGVPVVATAVAGTKEIIHDQQTGILAPPGSAPDLAQAILRWLALPPTTQQKIRETAQQFVKAKFSITAVGKQHQTLYQTLIQPNPTT